MVTTDLLDIEKFQYDSDGIKINLIFETYARSNGT